MAYVLHGERAPLTVDDLTIEVAPIVADPVYVAAIGLVVTALTAKPDAVQQARRDAYGFFVAEAQPTWAIVDHRGSIPATANGMLRLPDALAFRLIEAWTDLFTAEPPATAADAVLPPGPVRDAVNAKLRKTR